MSIYSMTGYGKGEASGTNYTVTCEIKTVNNRFKDFRFKMGSLFNSKEMELKKKLESEFKRGSFDIYINYKRKDVEAGFSHLDSIKIKNYLEKIKEVTKLSGIPLEIKPTDFLRSEFYLERDEEIEGELYLLLESCFNDAVKELKSVREVEGNKLLDVMMSCLNIYQTHYQSIIAQKNTYQTVVREKLEKRFKEEFKDVKMDETRFMQEVVYYLEKLDIDEEISRIEIHLSKMKKLLKDGGDVGKQMDFLLQEFGRETNTIGSKAQRNEISESVVQMKVQLEKIREQALNVE
ncbi:MAG: YicC/YloC family endoribonuclease [Bacteriovoracaceae bacterium]